MLGCFAVLLLRTALRPRWIGWFGATTAVLRLVALAFRQSELSEFPGFLVVLWVLVVGVRLLRSELSSAGPVRTSTLEPV
jgi:hypothetical protein